MIVRNRAAQRVNPSTSLFGLLLGLVFLIWAIAHSFEPFLLSMGILFLLWGTASFVTYRKGK
ncbi:hypothetical protein [Roseimicrobium sp. ORNL1]|uniref:hypothetical protein n=1 Tax=Roseimicrobium sp. ORNL1 TaxID=2711231 RepID=UPI0013E1915C|nr:hypothetical protein [Roseimicrobium sp. ORNL1]QIF04094.1 hypothetical protein G5S37_22045 [Roseimicrobium sp. ORNL1]